MYASAVMDVLLEGGGISLVPVQGAPYSFYRQ